MMLLDILFDIAIAIYTSLGFGTKEHKIESKMEKIGLSYPEAYDIYLRNRTTFESDETLSKNIMQLTLKNQDAVHTLVQDIYTQFSIISTR
jgi:hypothetical protein